MEGKYICKGTVFIGEMWVQIWTKTSIYGGITSYSIHLSVYPRFKEVMKCIYAFIKSGDKGRFCNKYTQACKVMADRYLPDDINMKIIEVNE